MSLAGKISSIIKHYKDDTLFEVSSDKDGLLLILDQGTFDKCKDAGKGNLGLLHQFIHLQMLEEAGVSEKIANGFIIETEFAVDLDRSSRNLLQIPTPWPGGFEVKVTGRTTKVDYKIELLLIDQADRQIHHYDRKGPLINLTQNEVYLPDKSQWLAIRAVEDHKNRGIDERCEYANLLAISKLQQSKKLGLDINLHHFNHIEAASPESISVSVKLDEEGNAELIPAFPGVSPDDVEPRLHNLEGGGQSLRIKDKILLIDEKKFDAIQEIITKNNIPKEQLDTFLKTPTAFLDATLIDLNLGFSLRVRGVTEFTHAYFGETDESGIEWFNARIPTDTILAPSKISQVICNEDELDDFQEKVNAARKTGATQIIYKDNVFDISDVTAINEAIESTRDRILSKPGEVPPDKIEQEEEDLVKVAIDIARNDAERDFGDDKVIDDVLYQDDIDWEKYKRRPYAYQERGIRWLLGLSCPTFDLKHEDLGKFGGLLADDMGLGKTYMSLVAVNEYLIQGKRLKQQEKPVLVVAPLSLLEIWNDELEMTYKESPFEDVVILQANADLNRYKQEGIGNETAQNRDTQIDQIRYSLKVGPTFNIDRLDRPRRIVLTTYHTLRDYQFSLAKVDWSFVIFDEAQNIKNPNTLATVAAKALTAHFKVIATGTPVENSLRDFWCLMDTAKPGYLNAYQEFRCKYIKPILQSTDAKKPEVRLGIGRALRHDVGSYMLRRIKEDQLEGLPKKTIYTGEEENETEKYSEVLKCTMTEPQRESYDSVIKLVSEQRELGEGENSVLSGLHRLRDVSLHPYLIEGGGMPLPENRQDAKKILAQSGKLAAMMQLLYEIQKKQEKVILFVINKHLQTFLKAALEKIFQKKVSIVNGDTKAIATRRGAETRKTLIADFEAEAGFFGLIIMSPIAAGTGLTIVGANHVIHLERHWNPAKEAQATDRVYRIGQKKDVSVYLPVLHHPDADVTSFDQNLNRLLNKKTALKDAVVTPEEVDPKILGSNLFGVNNATPIQSRPYHSKEMKQLSWQLFEAFVAELLAKHYQGEAMLTKEGSDKGADIIITETKKGTKNVLVQVKHIKNEKLSSVEPVREIFTAQPSYSEAMGIEFEELIVATNAKEIVPRVKDQADTFKVKLFGFKTLEKIMKQHQVTEMDVLRRSGKERYSI